MSLVNTWFFTKTIIDWDTFAKATHNQYRVVSVRPYVDKKGILPDGLSITVQVLRDDYAYGVDKQGIPRENNELQTFDATVLNRNHNIKKGDYIALLEFDQEHSYAIGFDLLLRFKNLQVLQPNKSNA